MGKKDGKQEKNYNERERKWDILGYDIGKEKRKKKKGEWD